MTNNTLVNTLRKIAFDSYDSNQFNALVQSLQRMALDKTQDATDKNGCEHDQKGRFTHKGAAAASKERANISRATSGERHALEKGVDPSGTRWRRIGPDEIPTIKGDTKSKARAARNKVFEDWQTHKEDGSYTLDGKLDNPKTGFQVSFQTTCGEGYNGSMSMSDEEYDRIVEELTKMTGSDPRIGVFGGIPEVSFTAPTMEMAFEIGNRFHQQSICDNARVSAGIFDDETFPMCPGYSWQHNPLHRMKDEINPFERRIRKA